MQRLSWECRFWVHLCVFSGIFALIFDWLSCSIREGIWGLTALFCLLSLQLAPTLRSFASLTESKKMTITEQRRMSDMNKHLMSNFVAAVMGLFLAICTAACGLLFIHDDSAMTPTFVYWFCRKYPKCFMI
ncbi:hypothetical protein [Shewanella surugensis]|uniref:Uncharacterized protein n=1 Tax=Shewanella surugensis TaxID=212020 RepID=A0ABT0L9B0_9GAMM|nr:hypothetical protein [Shewanella surugensis]MCL1124220.1 hypothetical protein [Shewanella surugensis]